VSAFTDARACPCQAAHDVRSHRRRLAIEQDYLAKKAKADALDPVEAAIPALGAGC
jgi:hypothetical protein